MGTSRIVWAATVLLAAVGCGPARTATPAGAAVKAPKGSLDRSRCVEEGKRVATADTNRDGRADVWKLFRGSELSCRQVDFDHDGKVDYVAHLDPGMVLTLEEFDLDFDGKFDEVIVYQGGQVLRQEFDTNHDGIPDIWKHFQDGRLTRMERDSNCSGQVDYWEEYRGGKLVRIRYADPDAKGGERIDDHPEDPDEGVVVDDGASPSPSEEKAPPTPKSEKTPPSAEGSP